MVTFHGCIVEHYQQIGYSEMNTYLQKLRYIAEKYAEKKIVMNSKKIIAVSEGLKKEILKHYLIREEKIMVVPNGVDIVKYVPNMKKRKEIKG